MVKLIDLKLGADPEIFLEDSKGSLVSAFNMVSGTKSAPYPVDSGAVQVDGIALEYNIDPANSQEEFVNNNLKVLESLRSMIPEELGFNIVPCVHLTPEFYKSQPKEALELGCEPSYSAYTGEIETVLARPDRRTAAGHIHLGFVEELSEPLPIGQCISLVKELDVFFNVLTLKYTDVEEETKRRSMYGASGSFRPKVYGLEYRALSNFWVKDPLLMRKVWDISNVVYDRARSGLFLSHKYKNSTALTDVTQEQIEEVCSIVSI